VAEAPGAGVEHHPEPLPVVLQLDEMVAAAQAAKLVLAAPGPGVPGDVPVVVHRDAVPLGRAPPGAQCLRPAPHDLLEALRGDGLAPRARPQAHPGHDPPGELLDLVRGGPVPGHLRAQHAHAAADVVAHRSHGQGAAGSDDAAHGDAVALVDVGGDGHVQHPRKAPGVLDLPAQALLHLLEEPLGHEEAHLPLLGAVPVEARWVAPGRALPGHGPGWRLRPASHRPAPPPV
jgi:hypothetical protein